MYYIVKSTCEIVGTFSRVWDSSATAFRRSWSHMFYTKIVCFWNAVKFSY